MSVFRSTPIPSTLRPATTGDAPAVAELLLASRRTFLPYAPLAHRPAEVRHWVAARLIPAGGVQLATIDGAVVGVVATAERGGIAWIDQLYLLPGFAGRGIGTQLLHHAQATRPAPIRLYCFQANVRARRFYERHGYVALHSTDGAENEERCPAVLYEWTGNPTASAA
jgi:GNAT superfamily N-acetyltransferase